MSRRVRYGILVIRPDGTAGWLRHHHHPTIQEFDKKTATINAAQLRENLGDEAQAVVYVRLPFKVAL